ncbi:tRNA pseudouridine(13) synthase TruD [Candidatus Woesearchaeota archaeon]|jgi:tRNA(Glu) U13 pseudouridine synthase TruD|nr:tRNA pseudouridine(13) synthase TruD [Candidatus Woesearchaeota archaeon]
MIKIKQKPEDFIVREKLDINKFLTDKGDFSYYKLTKTNYNTISAIKVIARSWRLNEKFINFAGTKDKNAVTEQYISIKNGPKKDLYIDNITLNYLGIGKERLNLGVLQGNEFEIIVETDKLPKKLSEKQIKKTINYFDDQRFGINKNNHVVGKLLIQKKFKEACEKISLDIKTFHVDSNNYVGALRTVHKKLLQLYVHAYQSYLWNSVVSEYIKTNYGNYELEYSLGKLCVPLVVNDLTGFSVPLIGFGSEDVLDKNEKIKPILEKIMEKEGIGVRDFIIRELPELSSEGDEREIIVNIDNLKIKEIEKKNIFIRVFNWVAMKSKKEEESKEVKKYKLTFTLQKGSYATMVVKTLFS